MQKISKGHYDEIVERMVACFDWFQEEGYPDNSYTLTLADGKRIDYSILPKNIPHLLGLKLDDMVVASLIRRGTPEEMFQSFIRNSYSIYTKINDGTIPLKAVFSDFVDFKLDAFSTQVRVPDPNEIYFVCEYDSSRNHFKKSVDSYTSDLYIARRDENDTIYLLGLKKQGRCHSAQTSRLMLDDEDLDEEMSMFLDGQVITFVNRLEITNTVKNFRSDPKYARYASKKQALEELQNLKSRYHAIVDTSKAHQYDLGKLMRNNTASGKKKDLLNLVMESILSGKVYTLTVEEEEILGEELTTFINGINDILISRVASASNDKNYSELVRDNKALADSVLKLTSERDDCLVKIETLQGDNSRLESINNELQGRAKKLVLVKKELEAIAEGISD